MKPDGTKGSFTPKHDSGHDDVHGEASTLPWHRYAISIFEDALVSECGWKMGMPCKSFTLTFEPGLTKCDVKIGTGSSIPNKAVVITWLRQSSIQSLALAGMARR